MEKKYKIVLCSQEKQVEFAKLCSKFSFDINLCKGTYIVDAKSVLGVCSIDTSKDCFVKINSIVENSQIKKFEEQLNQYMDK